METGVKFSTIYFGPINTKSWSGAKFGLFVLSEDEASRFIIKLLRKTNGEYVKKNKKKHLIIFGNTKSFETLLFFIYIYPQKIKFNKK
jgi:hypothetical protein